MLSRNCTEAWSIQATVTISGSSAKLIQNGIAPLPFPLPALLKQAWYIKRGERVRVRGHAQFYATLGLTRCRVYGLSQFSTSRVHHEGSDGAGACSPADLSQRNLRATWEEQEIGRSQ